MKSILARFFPRVRRARAPDFVSFWHGPIDGLTYGCLSSFAYHGAHLRLYTYDHRTDAPPGIELADAREICADASLVERYIADGKVEFSKFSNLFRYLLIQKTGCCWVDCDFLCLERPEFQHKEMVFGYQLPKENPAAINGAVLKLPREHDVLEDLVLHARAVVDLDQRWGTIGPRLLSPKLHEAGLSGFASDMAAFYPISYAHFWKLLLPAERTNVESAVRCSKLIHLWHHMFEVVGYNKNLAPPKGSYLHNALERFGGLDKFHGSYEVNSLKLQLRKWLP
ncbi:hypothetical protein ACTJKE_36410 [Ensifer sp. 22521]|uniref:hypothetical protein n=1 Tax=Ensifer sp. 22521 TaxID=3453935 RepID=UPI003F83BBEC